MEEKRSLADLVLFFHGIYVKKQKSIRYANWVDSNGRARLVGLIEPEPEHKTQ